MRSAPDGAWSQLIVRDGTARIGACEATVTSRDRSDSSGSLSRALVREGTVRRVGIHGAELHFAERASSM
jgi:hypothetical protein